MVNLLHLALSVIAIFLEGYSKKIHLKNSIIKNQVREKIKED